VPKTPAVLQLREGIRRAQAFTADHDTAAGLPTRADAEAAQEHPTHD
jgi:hypothetical protein